MSPRYLLLLIIVLYVAFALFVPAMQSIFGYGFGTLLALFVIWWRDRRPAVSRPQA